MPSHIASRRWRNALRLLGEQPAGDAPRRRDMLRLPLADHRLQPRAPTRQRLMRLGVARQHREVLILAEPVAQLLRLPHPAPPEPRPQRLDELHLIAMHHHALAQLVEVMRAGRPPVVRESGGAPAGSPRASPPPRRRTKSRRAASARSALRRGPAPPKSACGCALVRLAVSAEERRSSSLARIVSHDCDDSRCDGAWCSASATASSAACASRAPASIRARSRASVRQPRSSACRCGSTSRRKARQDFIAARKSCTATASTRLAVLHRGPALGEDMAGDAPQRVSDRLLRPQTRLVTHATVI